MSTAPVGWKLGTLGELAPLRYGKGLSESKRTTGGIAVYGSNGVVGHHDTALLAGPAIIVGRKGSVGEVHYCEGPCWPIDTTYFISDFGPFEPAFLAHALQWLNLSRLESSTAIPGLNRKDAEGQLLPVPPIPEQQRIVAKIDALFADVSVAQERLTRVRTILEQFRNSVLVTAKSGRLTGSSPETHHESRSLPLSAIVLSLDQGWSPRCENEPSQSSDKWGVIKTTAVQRLSFDERQNKRLPTTLTPRPDLEIKKGDLLITRAGPRARAGVTCLVRTVRPRLMICDKVYRFRVNPEVALPEFVNLVLNEPGAIEEIDSMKTGISDSGMNLTQDKFLGLEISLPPLARQREIVQRVEALFMLADDVDRRVQLALKRNQQLPQAILSRAFSGNLVVNEADVARAEGRTFESAAALIDRIASENTNGSRRLVSKKQPKATLPVRKKT
jgi:type I restriction enzyme, S subunit